MSGYPAHLSLTALCQADKYSELNGWRNTDGRQSALSGDTVGNVASSRDNGQMISAPSFHLVRLGIFGHVGRFRATDHAIFARGTRVVCRTRRGLEVGEVLAHSAMAGPDGTHVESADGDLVRGMTAEDELMLTRLNKNRDKAYESCSSLLREFSVPASLVDVESLFDGKSIYFYFHGEVPADIQPLVDQLGEAYEAQVKFRDFATAVETGCGPDCGTENAAGCGEGGGCSTCSIVSACKK